MIANGYYIFRYGPSVKLLCGLWMILHASNVVRIMSGLHFDNCRLYQRYYLEEKAVDKFLFERLSNEDLKNLKKEYSSWERFGDQHELSDGSLWGKSIAFMCHNFSCIHNFVLPQVPSDRDRSAAIAEELKCRGEK